VIALAALALVATTSAAPAPAAPAPAAVADSAGTLTEAQLAQAAHAGERLFVAMEETMAEAKRRLGERTPTSEGDLQAFAAAALAREHLVPAEPPTVCGNIHSADPSYVTSGDGTTPIHAGDVVLVDLTARDDAPGAPFADLTWVAFVGPRRALPADVAKAFAAVRDARDAVIARLSHDPPATGAALDALARETATRAGGGAAWLHPAGHDLGATPFGPGPNLAPGESRAIGPSRCVAIEPGLYRVNRFGVRAEADVCLDAAGNARVVTGTPQREIRLLLDE